MGSHAFAVLLTNGFPKRRRSARGLPTARMGTAKRMRYDFLRSRDIRPGVKLWSIELRGGLSEERYRESNDTPKLKAFCLVAPSVRLRVRAMLPARVFFFASALRVRTCSVVHARRFDFLAVF